jgi:hypothetical protein
VVSVFAARTIMVVVTYNITSNTAKYLRAAGMYLIIFLSGYFLLREYLYTAKNAEYSYSLGLALNKVSKQGDLVVTVAQDMGDPVAIYYSRRKGWVFPPAREWAPTELPKEDEEAIRDLEDLRIQGAKWLGITINHIEDIQVNHPLLFNYLQNHFPTQIRSKEYVIYKIR